MRKKRSEGVELLFILSISGLLCEFIHELCADQLYFLGIGFSKTIWMIEDRHVDHVLEMIDLETLRPNILCYRLFPASRVILLNYTLYTEQLRK